MLIRYFNERLVTSPRQRMGVTGREVLRWLAQPHILQTTRSAVRDAAARDRRVRRGVAHQRAGDGLRRPSRQRPRSAVEPVFAGPRFQRQTGGSRAAPCSGACAGSGVRAGILTETIVR